MSTTPDGLTSVLELKSVKMLQWFLDLRGAWPGHLFGQRSKSCSFILKYQALIGGFLVLAGCLNFLFQEGEHLDLHILSQMMIAVFSLILGMCHLVAPSFHYYEHPIKEFLEKYHLYHVRNYSKYNKSIYDYTCKILIRYYIVECAIILLIPTSVTFICFVLNLNNGVYSKHGASANVTLEYISHWSMYFLTSDDFPLLTHGIDFFGSGMCTLAILSADALVVTMVSHLYGHLNILRYETERLNIQTDQEIKQKHYSYDKEENTMIRQKLIHIVGLHNNVILFCKNISSLCGLPLVANLVFQVGCGCLLLILTTTLEPTKALRFMMVLISTMVELVTVSSVFEMIVRESGKLPEAVYACAWEKCDVNNRRALLFLLRVAQEPLQVKALKIVPLGFTTMFKILKTMLSYYIFLRNFT